ncbi:MAG: pyruvate ferredoxin oxidoreductase [Candidatus Bathyarchaeia archaeon]|nr:pyruvate ferredoxin oxidoreductase [Candidatus Bathyarchaeota archaeon]
MVNLILDTGNHMVGYAVRAARVQVIAAYPITPQTSIVEQLATMVETAKLKARYICVESEHSALAACVGASYVGARTFTATSSQGLAYMHEMLHWTSGSRLPIVMAVVNRALGPPWNIWVDHADSLSQRDTGWIQIYCSSNQEIFDTVIQCYKACESPEVSLPAMVCLEGVTLSHTSMPAIIPEQFEVDEYLPPYNPAVTLNPERPKTFSNIFKPEDYMSLRHGLDGAMVRAMKILEDVALEYSTHFGLPYHGGLVEKYKLEDAEAAIVALGGLASEAKDAVDKLRLRGLKVGLLRVRVFRPFPKEEMRRLAEDLKFMIVLDRDISFGMEGILYTELKASLYDLQDRPSLTGFIVGLGGVDVKSSQIADMVIKCLEGKFKGTVWMEG